MVVDYTARDAALPSSDAALAPRKIERRCKSHTRALHKPCVIITALQLVPPVLFFLLPPFYELPRMSLFRFRGRLKLGTLQATTLLHPLFCTSKTFMTLLSQSGFNPPSTLLGMAACLQPSLNSNASGATPSIAKALEHLFFNLYSPDL